MHRAQPPGVSLLSESRHPAVLIASIDLRTHEASWLGLGKTVRQHLFCWETGVCRPNGAHHVVSAMYPVSRHPRSPLIRMLTGWRGSFFVEAGPIPLETLAGGVALVTIQYRMGQYGQPFAYLDRVQAHCRGDRPLPVPTFGPLVYQIRDGYPPAFPWRPYAGGVPAQEYIERSFERRRVHDPAARRTRSQGSWSLE